MSSQFVLENVLPPTYQNVFERSPTLLNMVRKFGTEHIDEACLPPNTLHNRMKLFQPVRSFVPDLDYRFSID
jgi:hypothetical protein